MGLPIQYSWGVVKHEYHRLADIPTTRKEWTRTWDWNLIKLLIDFDINNIHLFILLIVLLIS